jgi:RecA-family ATPase
MQIYDGGLYLTIQFPKLPYIISGGILPAKSRGVLFGPPKLGKSLLLNQVALSVANGKDWMGFPTVQSRMLYCNWEVRHDEWQDRLRKCSFKSQLPMNSNIQLVSDMRGLMLNLKPGQIELENDVALKRPQLIILDPYYKCLTKSTSDDDVVLESLHFLDYLIEQYSVSILIVHHTRKGIVFNGGIVDLGAQEMRGSYQIAMWVDSIISFSQAGSTMDKGILSFYCRQASKSLIPISLELDRSMAGWKIIP